jgi:sigma-B regulation protein RsbU (phosphoserine phosphatase)
MIHPIFPNRRPRTDAIIFLLGAISLVLCFALREYWLFKPLPTDWNARLKQVTDSVLAHSGVARDSVDILSEASVDTDVLEAVKTQYGVKTRQYLDTADIQHVLYRIKIQKKEKGSFSFNFSGGNRSRPKTKSPQILAEEGFTRVLWLNDHGNIIAETQRLKEDLLPALDTNALRERLLRLVPSTIPIQNLKWQPDTTDTKKISFVALIAQDSLLKTELLVSAKKVSSSPPVWSAEWQRRISTHIAPPAKNEAESGLSAKTIVLIIFWVLAVLSILSLLMVWVNRQRIKAVNTWILGIAFLTGISFTTYAAGAADIPWYALIFVLIFYTLGFGFFFVAVPIASIVSVMREVFAEKFYTLMRFSEKPLKSFHVGRMLLLGTSIGAAFTLIMMILPFFGELLNNGALATLHITPPSYVLSFILRAAYAPLLNVLGSIAPITFIFMTAPAMFAYWVLPRKYALAVALLITSLAWGLFEAIQGISVPAILVQGVFRASVGFAVLYFGDILAVIAFVVVESLLGSIGIFATHPFLLIVMGILLLLLVGAGFIAYRNTPETVSEADYKPNFLSLLEENERMHQEIAAAKSVQQKLLPRSMPTFESVVVSAACIPAYEVGGDYYDFFPLDDKRLGVLIGDVSGKGISAAFYITLAKGVIVSQVRGIGSPSDVLHRVNALLYGVMERGKFVSMIYGIYNTHSREFSFANAGHNPLVVRRTSGEVNTISAKGMAIGLDKGERFERAVTTDTVTLEKDDCILLYTDGVTEAMNTNNDEYGEERMIQAVQAAPLNPADIVSAALADVRKFVGKAHQHDDITLVALQAV